MPRRWSGPRSRRSCQPAGELTLADSADARLPVARLRKARAPRTDVPDCWEDVVDEPPDRHADSAGGGGLWHAGGGRAERGAGRRYPPELWYLIGRHVAPEDVARFAAICRDAYRSTLTRQFWVRLYWHWCAPPTPLGLLAAPDFVQEQRGCRAAVVRALHRLYGPLRALRRRAADSTDTCRLVGAQCINMGRAPAGGDFWLYCLVFRRPVSQFHQRLAPPSCRDVRLARELLFENADEGTTCLLVRAHGTSQLPAVFGHVVHSVSVTMTTGMQQKMSIVFTQTGYREGGCRAPAAYLSRVLVLAPVNSFRLVHWWHDEFHEVFHKHMLAGKESAVPAPS
ncbi:transmembrane protein 183-like [Amphibalanus amphitrite]|uniref:transmembrane protein 183-like n=1 Tax=Amphibalanus amphitrite TaxID=1232801 RepID=UPI001C90AC9E|nr:transmembrane protein 183-like [Amphibalanus amphitrite]XP_043206457.1 transmembrane protein 183-like [Amphibalanus amphitrite]